MPIDWTHAAPTVAAAFFASLVEFVEALTIVLAVGAVRGWRGALGGAGLALLLLLLLVAIFGPAMTKIPQGIVQLGLGGLLLLFGMRWLRKATRAFPEHSDKARNLSLDDRLRQSSAMAKRGPRIPQSIPGAAALGVDLLVYAREPVRRRCGRPPAHDLESWRVVDDWPERVPVTEREVDVFEAWFGDLLDKLFGPI